MKQIMLYFQFNDQTVKIIQHHQRTWLLELMVRDNTKSKIVLINLNKIDFQNLTVSISQYQFSINLMLEEKALNVLFPQYISLFTPSTLFSNTDLQYFITNQLPSLISTVQNLESVFMKLQTSHTNLIVKSPPTDTLIQSFIRKVNQKVEKYMNGMDQLIQNESNEHFDFKQLRKLMKEKLTDLQPEITQKYVKNKGLNRVSEQLIAQSIYRIIQYYNFTKADIHNIANKYLINSRGILSDVKILTEPTSINSLVSLDQEVKTGIQEFVDKRMRPFLQKKQFLGNKIKDILKEQENKYSLDLKGVLKILLAKEKGRCQRQIYNQLQTHSKGKSISRSLSEDPIQLNNQMNLIKSEFNKLKSSPYYLEIIRGTFKLTFGNQSNSLENLFGICKLEEYLLSSAKLTQRMSQLLKNLIDYRKDTNSEIGRMLEDVVQSCIQDMGKKEDISLQTMISEEFERLKQLLITDVVPQESSNNRFNQQKVERQQQRKRRIEQQRQKRVKDSERRKIQLEQKAQKQKKLREEKKQIDQQRRLQQRQQMKQKQEIRKREEAERLQKYAKEKERMEQEKMLRQESRKQSEIERKQKLEEEKRQRQNQRQQKNREKEKEKQKKSGEDKLKLTELERKNRQKIAVQQQKEEKRKLEEKQKKQEKERQQKKKDEELRIQKEKAEEEERRKQLKKKEDERLALEKRIKDQQLKNKELADQKEKKQKEERELKLKKEEEERIKKEKLDNQNKQRIRMQRQNQEKEKIRIQNQNKQKIRIENQNKEKEKQRIENERIERERIQKEKEKEKQRIEQEIKLKQKAQKQRIENERKQKQRIQNERIQKERIQKQRIAAEQLKQRQRIEEEKKEREQQRRRKQDEEKEAERIRAQNVKKEQQLRMKKQKEEEQKATLKRQKQKQEEIQKQKQKQKSKVDKNKKQSDFDYNNMYEEDFQPEEQVPKKPSKEVKKPPQQKNDDFDFLDEVDVDFGLDDDAGEDRPEQEAGGDIIPKQLTTAANVNLFNNSIKSTQYMRKNKPNIYNFNNMKQFAALFQEMVQNTEMFIFSDMVSQAVLESAQKLIDGEEGVEDDLDQIAEVIGEQYRNTLETDQFENSTKFYFVYKDINPLGLIAFQFEIGGETEQGIQLPKFTFFLTKNVEENQQQLLELIKVVCMIFGIEIGNAEEEFPEDHLVVLPPSSVELLNSMTQYLPALLVLYNWMYEYRKEDKEVLIDQYTVERFFYCSHALTTLYPAIEQSEEEMYQFYDKMYQQFNTGKDVQTHRFQHLQTDNQPLLKMVQDFKSCVNKFSKQKTISSHLLMTITLVKVDEQQNAIGNISLYISMSREPTPNIKFYILGPDMQAQDFLSRLYENIAENCKKEMEGFQVQIYMDFTRHNGLYQYVNWSLPIWAKMVTKRKMTPLDAMVVLNFSMLPYISVFKGQD